MFLIQQHERDVQRGVDHITTGLVENEFIGHVFQVVFLPGDDKDEEGSVEKDGNLDQDDTHHT